MIHKPSFFEESVASDSSVIHKPNFEESVTEPLRKGGWGARRDAEQPYSFPRRCRFVLPCSSSSSRSSRAQGVAGVAGGPGKVRLFVLKNLLFSMVSWRLVLLCRHLPPGEWPAPRPVRAKPWEICLGDRPIVGRPNSAWRDDRGHHGGTTTMCTRVTTCDTKTNT